ncbi:MAG: hypothetical protein SAJ12_05235 [Jaaginema sp. PMC 1079.18]|nr:hypothetical protein [Jaaginema sp. PMC 1080.18]MEC4850396.1 hypothetical protein [Jaaginema sp. PMC 1079.18]MEC4865135.1 hypothetical protein [Jaaginema sp. PMC 1078.18]
MKKALLCFLTTASLLLAESRSLANSSNLQINGLPPVCAVQELQLDKIGLIVDDFFIGTQKVLQEYLIAGQFREALALLETLSPVDQQSFAYSLPFLLKVTLQEGTPADNLALRNYLISWAEYNSEFPLSQARELDRFIKIYLQAGQLENAIALSSKAISWINNFEDDENPNKWLNWEAIVNPYLQMQQDTVALQLSDLTDNIPFQVYIRIRATWPYLDEQHFDVAQTFLTEALSLTNTITTDEERASWLLEIAAIYRNINSVRSRDLLTTAIPLIQSLTPSDRKVSLLLEAAYQQQKLQIDSQSLLSQAYQDIMAIAPATLQPYQVTQFGEQYLLFKQPARTRSLFELALDISKDSYTRNSTFYDIVRIYGENGQFDLALEQVQRMEAENLVDTNITVAQLAQEMLKQERFEEGLALVKNLPVGEATYLDYAVTHYLKMGETAKAIAIAKQQQNLQGFFTVANDYRIENKQEAARQIMQLALDIAPDVFPDDPENAIASVINQATQFYFFTEAVQGLEKLNNPELKDLYEQMLLRSISTAMALGEEATVVEFIEQLPDNSLTVKILNQVAQSYAMMGQKAASLALTEQIASLIPKMPDAEQENARLSLAEVYTLLHESDRALVLAETHYLNSTASTEQLKLVDLYLESGKEGMAIATLDRLLATSPAVSILSQIAFRYADAGQFEKALELLSNTVQQAQTQNYSDDDLNWIMNAYNRIITSSDRANNPTLKTQVSNSAQAFAQTLNPENYDTYQVKIFDCLQQTLLKEVGKGTGLGLAIVH